MIESNKVCAGIVLYNPDLERLLLVVESIINQVEKLYLVDNASENIANIKELMTSFPHLLLIENNKNMGIARALNQICQKGYDDNYRWVVTLDQDTICPENLVCQLSRFKNDDIGIVCPAVSYEGLDVHSEMDEDETEYVYACMTSSSLTNIRGWKEVGGFKESYFIDFVDNEFCMKLSLKGYKILRTYACEIQHQLGCTREIRILGRRYRGTSHSLIRCYYMMRNNVLFICEYSSHLNILKECLKLIYVAWGEFFYSSNKCKTLKYLLYGIKDGIKGKEGPYEA